MSAHDKLARTKFGDVEFPAEEHVVHGTGRVHVHEYWKSPGGAPEKGGRGLYSVTIRGNFQDRFPAYPNLYPDAMNRLRADYESQTTRLLVHPTFGTFPAFIKDWRQVKSARLRSGEKVDLEFMEDQLQAFTTTAFVGASLGSIQSTAAALDAEIALIKTQISLESNAQGLFDSIQSVVNSILAIKDTADLYGNLLAAKVTQLTNIVNQVDSLRSMQDPHAWPVVDALHELWGAANKLLLNTQANAKQLQKYTVPTTMPLASVAINIYSDSSRQSDLLALNANVVPNPMRVLAGTVINYYPAN